MRLKCKACGAEYDPVQADGMEYYHQCGPLSRVELAAAVQRGKLTLPAGESVDDAIARRVYERANKRDENVPSTRATDSGRVKAAGAGADPIADPAPGRVVVP